MANLADLHADTGLADLAHTGGTVTSETARRMACDAELITVLFGDAGQILNTGRARRLATRPQRDALIARDRGCAAPGCDAPPAWTEAHHIIHWAHGGRTDLDNLTLLCSRHHRAVHTGHLKLDPPATTHHTPRTPRPPPAQAA